MTFAKPDGEVDVFLSSPSTLPQDRLREDRLHQRALERSFSDLQRMHGGSHTYQSNKEPFSSYASQNIRSPSKTGPITLYLSCASSFKSPPPKPSRKPTLILDPVQLGLFNPVKREPKACEELRHISGIHESIPVNHTTRRSFVEMERQIKSGLLRSESLEESSRIIGPTPLTNISKDLRKGLHIVNELYCSNKQSPSTSQKKLIDGKSHKNEVQPSLILELSLAIPSQSLQTKLPSSNVSIKKFVTKEEESLKDAASKLSSNKQCVPIKPSKPPIGKYSQLDNDFSKDAASKLSLKKTHLPERPIKLFANYPDEIPHASKIQLQKPPTPIKPSKLSIARHNLHSGKASEPSARGLFAPPKPSKPPIEKFTQTDNKLLKEAAAKPSPRKLIAPTKPPIKQFTQSDEYFLKEAASRLSSSASRASQKLVAPARCSATDTSLPAKKVTGPPPKPTKNSRSVSNDMEQKIGLSAIKIEPPLVSSKAVGNFQCHLASLLRSNTTPVSRTTPAVDVVVRSSTSVEESIPSITSSSKARSKGPKRRLPKKLAKK